MSSLLPLLLALAPASDFTGVYELTGVPSDVRLVLHERAGGKIIGYIAGSPRTWIESGQRYGDGALIHIHGEDGGSAGGWTATVRVFAVGGQWLGVIIIDKDVLPITLSPTKQSFTEEPWLWLDSVSYDVADISRLLDPGSNFLGGGFSGQSSCHFMACGGSIDSWTVTGTAHAITTSSTGDCGQNSTLNGTFDSTTNQLDGTWSTIDCNSNASGGTFLGGKAGATTSKHIQALLLSLGEFADDFEAESMDAADVFHSAYMSDGTTRAAWETQFSAWYAAYDQIEIETTEINELITIIDSDIHPYLLSDPRLTWTVRATGLNIATGVVETFWEREEPDILGPDLYLIGTESGRTVFIGNGQTQPLSIGLPIQLTDVSYAGYFAWPFGVHGGGHADDGHPGIDFSFLAGSQVYAVEAGTITAIIPNTGWPLPQWDVTQEIRPGVHVQYGHIADPPSVLVGDVLAMGDPIGNPSNFGDTDEIMHFALSMGTDEGTCPVPWFNASAKADWDTLFALASFSEELCEPLECNDRDASPPFTATWNLETAGTFTGPDSIYFYRADGYAHDYDYTFFDTTGAAYESGSTSWASSPSTIGLHFTANGTGTTTYAAADIINDELTFKLDTTSMPTDLTGAAIYRYQQ